MTGLIDVFTVLIGVIIWQYLKPQLGWGGLIIGGLVAFFLRLIILRLFDFRSRRPNNMENTTDDLPSGRNIDGNSPEEPDIKERKE